ncbi:MAG TPA: phospholipase D-like domain-containing protein [Candidatus Paceibacterota bacterium]
MHRKYIALMILLAIVAIALFIAAPKVFTRKEEAIPTSGALSLITEPDDGVAPVLAMINGARASLDLVMYELDDARIESALAADERRGVAVRVILSGGYNGASSTTPATMNAAAYDFLVAHGVSVRWSPAYFSLTHEKSLVIDGDRALIMTFNLVSKYYATGRDFGIIDGDPRDVAAIEHTFDADWEGNAAVAGSGNNGGAGDDLVWSPGSEPVLIDLIANAKKSLYIYNEEMDDTDVTKALIDAAERGVAVYVDMTGAAEWKWEFEELTTAGAHVRTYADDPAAPLYIHAKMIVADDGTTSERAFVGSENFSPTSLGENRELGVITRDQTIIASLVKTFTADWRGATPFAL